MYEIRRNFKFNFIKLLFLCVYFFLIVGNRTAQMRVCVCI